MKTYTTHKWKKAVRKGGFALMVMSLLPSLVAPMVAYAAPQDTYSWLKNIGTSGCRSTMSPRDSLVTNNRLYVYDTQYGNISPDGPYEARKVRVFDMSGTLLFSFGSAGTGNGQFGSGMADIAVDSAGDIYISDSGNNRVQKFAPDGTYLSQFGSQGTGNGQFDGAAGITIDDNDNIYVLDADNYRVQKFNTAGVYQSRFGTSGSGNGQFEFLGDIASDASGNVYVSDGNYTSRSRIQKFNNAGVYQSQIGNYGTGNGQFTGIPNIDIDPSGNIIAVDSYSYRVQKFNSAGVYQSQFGTQGTASGQINAAQAMSLDAAGNVYISDQNYASGSEYGRVTQFDGNGTYLSEISYNVNTDPTTLCEPISAEIAPDGSLYVLDSSYWEGQGWDNVKVYNKAGTLVRVFGSFGSGNGQLNCPTDLAIDANTMIYIADNCNDRVQKFDANGTYVAQFGTSGSASGQFTGPRDIAIDAAGNLLITDGITYGTPFARVQKFDANGTYLSQFGTYGSGNGQFENPSGIAVDSGGNVYVGDRNLARVQKFDANGAYVSQFGTAGSGNGQFDDIMGIAVDGQDRVYVADTRNNNVQIFDAAGVFLNAFGVAGAGGGQFGSASPLGIVIDLDGNAYVSDDDNARISVWNAPIIPSAPQDVSAAPASSTSLRVTWRAPAHIGSSSLTGYQIQYRLVGASAWTIASTVGPTLLSYVLDGLKTDAAYEIQVIAMNALGSSSDIPSQASLGIVTATPRAGGELAETGVDTWIYGLSGGLLVAGATTVLVVAKRPVRQRRKTWV